MAYMARVDDATSTTTSGLECAFASNHSIFRILLTEDQGFKIYEVGLDTNNTWAVDKLIANAGNVSMTIPSCIPSGQYLLRAELIALHSASTYPGAQFYMECAQIKVTGGGSASPDTVAFPGAYEGTDPGITFNVSFICADCLLVWDVWLMWWVRASFIILRLLSIVFLDLRFSSVLLEGRSVFPLDNEDVQSFESAGRRRIRCHKHVCYNQSCIPRRRWTACSLSQVVYLKPRFSLSLRSNQSSSPLFSRISTARLLLLA